MRPRKRLLPGEELPQGWVLGSVGCFVHYGFIKEGVIEIIPDLDLTFDSGASIYALCGTGA